MFRFEIVTMELQVLQIEASSLSDACTQVRSAGFSIRTVRQL